MRSCPVWTAVLCCSCPVHATHGGRQCSSPKCPWRQKASLQCRLFRHACISGACSCLTCSQLQVCYAVHTYGRVPRPYAVIHTAAADRCASLLLGMYWLSVAGLSVSCIICNPAEHGCSTCKSFCIHYGTTSQQQPVPWVPAHRPVLTCPLNCTLWCPPHLPFLLLPSWTCCPCCPPPLLSYPYFLSPPHTPHRPSPQPQPWPTVPPGPPPSPHLPPSQHFRHQLGPSHTVLECTRCAHWASNP
jgi:hypothetical protein